MEFAVSSRSFFLKTHDRVELIDITGEVEDFVESSGIREGVCILSVPHATASIIINENERGLIEDIKAHVEELFPQGKNYRHNLIDNNASAHIASSFLGSSRIIPISNGKLRRGTWQNIMFLELDGPREKREIIAVAMGMKK